MNKCTCKEHGEIKKGTALVECNICKGYKPIDRIITMGINGNIRIYNSQEEYDEHLAKGVKNLFDNSFTNDPAIMNKYKAKGD